MSDNKLISTLADQLISAKIDEARDGDIEAAKELIILIKDLLIEYAAVTPQKILDEGYTLIDLEIAEFLFDAFSEIENGESAGHALLIKQKGRGRPPKPRSEKFKEIMLARLVHEHMKSGLTQNDAVIEVEIKFSWASESMIKRAFRKHRNILSNLH